MKQVVDVKEQVKESQNTLSALIFSVISAVLWGLLIGLVINGYWWFKEGYGALSQELAQTYHSQIQHITLRSSTLGSWFDAELARGEQEAELGTERLKKKTMRYAFARKAVERIGPHHIAQAKKYVMQGITLFTDTFKVLAAKFISVFASSWVLLFAFILGALDGLCARYVRTMEGGRESTFVFHRISSIAIKTPVAILFVYLSLPIFLNPEWVVILLSVLCFGFAYTSTASLKKFL